MNKNIVCKFGGTSLASSENIRKVKEIVLGDNKRFVIVSAPGKRTKDDTKRFYWHTGYMGGIKFRTMGKLRQEHPERIIENSVRRMISRNPLGRQIIKKL